MEPPFGRQAVGPGVRLDHDGMTYDECMRARGRVLRREPLKSTANPNSKERVQELQFYGPDSG
jgi:hypothetical protein